MASHLKPYRGKKATAESQNIVLKRGEVFFEVPAGGVGTGIGKIKMGDGTTAYSDLPYFASVDDTVVSWTDTADTIDTNNNTNVALLNAFVPTKNVKSLFGTAKQLLVNLDRSVTVLNNKKVDLSNYYTKADIDNKGYLLTSTAESTYAKLSSIPNMSNYYTKTETDSKITNIKTEYSSIFGAIDKVGDIGMITDGTYNVRWVIYSISGNTYQLFPMKNLTNHQMNSTATNRGGYASSEMYGFIHNTVLPNLKRSGLNITACDLVSKDVYNDICTKTGITNATVAGGEGFWLADPGPGNSDYFYLVDSGGSIGGSGVGSYGVRPLITVVK